MKIGTVAFLTVLLASGVKASVEQVYVQKVLNDDDKAIIVRVNGEAFLIEKGIGCLSLWRYEGKRVYISSPATFLGVGSELLMPDVDQKCRIWDSKSLGSTISGPVPPIPRTQSATTGSPQLIGAIQRALNILGYDVPTNGIADSKTKEAFTVYQQSKRQPGTDEGLRMTLMSLAIDVLAKRPTNTDSLGIANQLYQAMKADGQATGSQNCVEGHWVSSVMDDGKLVKLEDNSIWEVDPVDSIDSALWLPTEEVLVCGDKLINTDNGERVQAKRLK